MEEIPRIRVLSQEASKYIGETIEYLKTTKPNLNEKALQSYRNRLISVLNRLEDIGVPLDPTSLGIRDGVMYLHEIHLEKLSRTTVELYCQALKLYAVSHGNHNLDAISFKLLRKLSYNWLSRKEVLKICNADLETEYETVFHLQICFGLREDQICRLKVSDIDFENKTVNIAPTPETDETAITRPFHVADRFVPVDSEKVFRTFMEYRGHLVKWISLLNPNVEVPEELFIYEMGKTLNSFDVTSTTIVNRIRAIGKRTGVHLTSGKNVNTYARNLFYQGMSSEEIRKNTGLNTDFTLCAEAA